MPKFLKIAGVDVLVFAGPLATIELAAQVFALVRPSLAS